MKTSNRTVLVTGASKGIGAATAIAFAKEGYGIVLNFKSDKAAAKKVLNECNLYSEKNMLIQADVSLESEVAAMLKVIKKIYSKIDVVVNNVGIFDEEDNTTNVKVFERIFRNNFLSAVTVVKYSIPLMRKGKIINISSIHGRLGHGRPTAAAYSSMKAALESYTKNLAKDLAPNILVNAIAPGRVNTPMWDSPSKKRQQELGKAHLIQRMIQPSEVADAIMFLAKNDAMCGEVLTIDGGMGLATLK